MFGRYYFLFDCQGCKTSCWGPADTESIAWRKRLVSQFDLYVRLLSCLGCMIDKKLLCVIHVREPRSYVICQGCRTSCWGPAGTESIAWRKRLVSQFDLYVRFLRCVGCMIDKKLLCVIHVREPRSYVIGDCMSVLIAKGCGTSCRRPADTESIAWRKCLVSQKSASRLLSCLGCIIHI